MINKRTALINKRENTKKILLTQKMIINNTPD